LKRNCHIGGRENSSTKISSIRPITEEAQAEQEEDGDFEDTKTTQCGRDGLMTKLRGISV